MPVIRELEANELFRNCNPQALGFTNTDELDEVVNTVGQNRASEAIAFGLNIDYPGYNIFALGPAGTGKRDIIQAFIKNRASKDPTPSDWIYVHDFDNPDQPGAIELPPGMGKRYENNIQELIEELQTALSAAFESEEYQNRRQSIFEDFKNKQAALFDALKEKADENNVAMIKTPSGIAFAPKNEEGVLSAEEVDSLTEKERSNIQANIQDLQEELQKILQQVPVWQREARAAIKTLNKEMANFAIGGLFNELLEKYKKYEEIVNHLNQIQDQVVENSEAFLPGDEQEPTSFMEAFFQPPNIGATLLEKLKVNLFIDNSECQGAPVIFEQNPTYPNLIGRVEYFSQMGTLRTDYRMIKPGAMHKANGGYLILDAHKLLSQPYAWEGLKRALQSQEIEIESLGQALSIISTVSLKPEAIPINLKIALIGDRLLYYLLVQYDPEFLELFKVEADFETEIDWDEKNQSLYARLVASIVQIEKTLPMINEAVARLIEQSARQASDTLKLNSKLHDLKQLIHESDYWAKENGHAYITREDVQQAIDASIRRADRLSGKLQESILRDINLISTQGEKIGQINGISIYALGTFIFGKPTRITSQISLGKGQVVDIEREVEMGGPIHSKGVLILAGFLKGRYAQETPLSLSASIVFEQSYGGVDGDSASSAELYAILSNIAGTPIKQNLAVTGSVNQHGQVQAIGGVNQKIEGFFDICKARGLTGDQGVLIPNSNVQHLMLRNEVIDAVEKGNFHIYPVEHIDEGMEILTGIPAGEIQEDGTYPAGTVNAMVQQRLMKMAQRLSEFGSQKEKNDA